MNIDKVKLETTGLVRLKHGYTLTNIIYVRTSEKYVPYIVGSTISGPRGGDYMLDAFGTSEVIRRLNLRIEHGITCMVMNPENGDVLRSNVITDVLGFSKAKDGIDKAKIASKAFGIRYIDRSNLGNFLKRLCK